LEFIGGRTDNMFANIINAAVNGYNQGAIGLLCTDWGDNGHYQPTYITSYLGFIAAAKFSWNSHSDKKYKRYTFAPLLNHYCFQDSANITGEVVYDLGNAYLHISDPGSNGSALFRILQFACRDNMKQHPLLASISVNSCVATQKFIQEQLNKIDRAEIKCKNAELYLEELRFIGNLMTFACKLYIALETNKLVNISALSYQDKESLYPVLQKLVEKHKELWLQRSRPGGLQDSIKLLDSILINLKNPTD